MRNLNEILSKVTSDSCVIDGRDLHRLMRFVNAEDLTKYGFKVTEGHTHVPEEFTEENVKKCLKADLAFGFEKALNRRGISAGLMFEVVKMWCWVLEDEEHAEWSDDNYAMYGLPLFKSVALKYGFENPIGDDTGAEAHYEKQYDGY